MDNTEANAAVTPDASNAVPAPPRNWSPIPDIGEDEQSWGVSLWRRLCREPALLFSTAYVLVAFLGLWSSVWFYQGFGIAILDYLQASDYLVAGLRNPAYILILAGGVLLAGFITWPDTVRRRYPQYIDELRRRHWWARAIFARSRLMSWEGVGIHPVTGISLVVASIMLLGAALYMQAKGEQLRAGRGSSPVQVRMLGDAAPLPGEARLLGTSSAFVYLWWPAQRRAEAVPITSLRQLQAMPVKQPMAKQPSPGEGGQAVPAAR